MLYDLHFIEIGLTQKSVFESPCSSFIISCLLFFKLFYQDKLSNKKMSVKGLRKNIWHWQVLTMVNFFHIVDTFISKIVIYCNVTIICGYISFPFFFLPFSIYFYLFQPVTPWMNDMAVWVEPCMVLLFLSRDRRCGEKIPCPLLRGKGGIGRRAAGGAVKHVTCFQRRTYPLSIFLVIFKFFCFFFQVFYKCFCTYIKL